MRKLSYNYFPNNLKQISSCPSSLYYEGDISLLKKKTITIVGTRSITEYGIWVIEHLLDNFLKNLDIVVVSGLARGVDAHVHRVCLEREIKTVAIVPGAISSYIPKTNLEIFKRLKKEGLVIAEFPEEISFNKKMFVLRNRLLAGISQSTLVVEAGIKSGSLITAGLALDYNRDVYIIPGNINNKMSQGCNTLAKQGAGIVTSLDDFKEIFGVQNSQIYF
jgi:DNA processing protein